MSLIAVYGTLRKGAPNHNIIKMGGSTYLGEAVVDGFEMFDTGMGYPACVDGDGQVVVEVYDVDAYTEECLDVLEGVPHHYVKDVVDTPYGVASIYLYMERLFLKNQVMYGDWIKYTKEGV